MHMLDMLQLLMPAFFFLREALVKLLAAGGPCDVLLRSVYQQVG